MAMWTHYYDLPDRWIEDDRMWKCMDCGRIKTDPVTGERSVDYDPKELRREGDFLISISENRLHLCISTEEVIRVPDGVRSIATGAFTKDSTPNLRHLILPMSVDGVGREAIIDCEEFEELTYYNDRIYVCDDAFNARRLKLMHYPPENQTWDLSEMWRRHDAAMQRQTPDPIPEVSDEDLEDMDLPF
jgi:hypothetical protein